MAYFPLNSQQNIPSQEIQRNFVGGELSVVSSGLFYLRLATRGSWRALFCFPVWIISSVRDIRADVWSGRLVLFTRDTAGCPRKSHVMCKPVHSISKTLFIWDILRIFVPVARDGRLKGWKLSAAPGGDRLYSWEHWHLTALLWSPLSIVPLWFLLSLAGLLPPGFEHWWPPPGCGEESVTENTFHIIFISTLHWSGNGKKIF